MRSTDGEQADNAEANDDNASRAEDKSVGDIQEHEEGTGPQTDEIDLVQALGASIELSPQELRLYIPNKDRRGNEFGCQRKWVLEAAQLLAKIGGGVTMLPAAEGGWFDKENQVIIWENPILLYTYVKPDLFERHLPELREFLHRLGRETNQGEVALEFDGDFYRIDRYDPFQESLNMGRRVRISSKPLKRIRVTSPTLKRLDREDVAKALGAELVEEGIPKSVLPTRDARRNGSGRSDG